MKLKKGEKYDTSNLSLLYWKAGSKVAPNGHADLCGYSLFSYFDGEGRYLGPDKYGVEPVVEIEDCGGGSWDRDEDCECLACQQMNVEAK